MSSSRGNAKSSPTLTRTMRCQSILNRFSCSDSTYGRLRTRAPARLITRALSERSHLCAQAAWICTWSSCTRWSRSALRASETPGTLSQRCQRPKPTSKNRHPTVFPGADCARLDIEAQVEEGIVSLAHEVARVAVNVVDQHAVVQRAHHLAQSALYFSTTWAHGDGREQSPPADFSSASKSTWNISCTSCCKAEHTSHLICAGN